MISKEEEEEKYRRYRELAEKGDLLELELRKVRKQVESAYKVWKVCCLIRELGGEEDGKEDCK